MTLTDIILGSAIGQLVAIGAVALAWVVVKTYQVVSAFVVAANQTRVRIVCEKKSR